MKKQNLIFAIVVALTAQNSFADWKSSGQHNTFTGADLAQETTFSARRFSGNANVQTLSFIHNDHQEVNDIFNRNQTYDGLHFTSTTAISSADNLHFSSQLSRNEQHFGSVYSSGNWLFGLSAGQAENFVKTSQAFTGIDPYFVHGGSATRFKYYGTNAGYSFDNNSILYAGSSTIEASQLDDRHAHYAGFQAKNVSATLINFKREGKSIGKGLEMAADINNYLFGYRAISRNNGAHSKTISMQWPTSVVNAGKLGFAVESVNNPLNREHDDVNFMLTLSGVWGKSASVYNASEQPQDDQPQTTGLNKMAVIGAGVVAGAVILSSGSSSKDSNESFSASNQTEAARQILNQINPRSVDENREFGGLVYRNPNGSFSSTSPIRGTESSVLISPVTPQGTRATAIYHTHAAFDPKFDNENFSPTDINSANRSGLDSYLGTPAGAFKFYDRSKGTIATLGLIAN